MKKINFFIAILSLTFFFTSCSEDDNDVSTSELQTTSVMSILETSQDNNTAGRTPTDRPGSVLDWIETIEITADHVGTIGAPYSVSDIYTMIDDGSGADNFVLENVALGENKFEAFAKSYNQTPAEEVFWVVDQADAPWQWIDAQRLRAPNANFRDTDNATQTIFENPAAGQNVVNFDMKAESGRLIVAVRLSDEIRNDFFSNHVYVQHRIKYADGSISDWSDIAEFNNEHKDDLLTFYFSDNTRSVKDACVEGKFIISDSSAVVTNTFTKEICIPDNGKSIGCVYEVTGDSVVEDVTDFNFTFDWEELDCAPCPSNDYVTTVPRYVYKQQLMLELCGLPVGSFVDITEEFPIPYVYNWSAQQIFNIDGSASNVWEVANWRAPGSASLDLRLGNNVIATIPANSRYLIALPENTTFNNLIVDGYAPGAVYTNGTILGCE